MFSNLAIHLCKITLHLCFAWFVTYIPVVSMMISKMAVIARKHQDKLCFYFYKLLKFNRIRRKADQTRWEMKVSSVPGLAYPWLTLPGSPGSPYGRMHLGLGIYMFGTGNARVWHTGHAQWLLPVVWACSVGFMWSCDL